MVWKLVLTVPLQAKTVKTYNADGEEKEDYNLPPIFSLPVRLDLIRRAYLSAFTAALQPKGRDPMAGRRTTAHSWGVGRGMARVPRLPNGRAAFISFARGGHAAFGPHVNERLHERINKREKAYAVASAIAATGREEFVRSRGHVFTVKRLPVILEDEVEDSISRTSDVRKLLSGLGLWSDIVRSQEKTRIRAGKGKMRGRRYVEPKSILFVVTSYTKPFAKAVRNLPGVDVATPANLGILHLAPGGVPGRLTVYVKTALEEIASRYEVLHI
jgi:large subunit ribosomal protein L4e